MSRGFSCRGAVALVIGLAALAPGVAGHVGVSQSSGVDFRITAETGLEEMAGRIVRDPGALSPFPGLGSPGEWIEECERRGWEPRRDTIVGVLRSLERAIVDRGGQRRARTYVRSQLRRLTRAERTGQA